MLNDSRQNLSVYVKSRSFKKNDLGTGKKEVQIDLVMRTGIQNDDRQ